MDIRTRMFPRDKLAALRLVHLVRDSGQAHRFRERRSWLHHLLRVHLRRQRIVLHRAHCAEDFAVACGVGFLDV